MYEIKIFENPDFGQVRTTTGENGTPLFCAVDVCRALGYGKSREALRKHVMEDDVTKRDTIDSIGRKQQTSFINESGFYALCFGIFQQAPEGSRVQALGDFGGAATDQKDVLSHVPFKAARRTPVIGVRRLH